MQKNSIGVPLLVFVLFSGAFAFIPASAEEHDSTNFLQLLLDQSRDQVNTKMLELEAAGIPIPSSVDAFNTRGQAGYEAALASIAAGNLDEANEHALGAMSSFENALGGLFETEEGDPDDNTDEINELVDAISNSESDAAGLLELSLQNPLLVISFSDYDDAIESAKALLAEGDLGGALEQFEIAENLLEDIIDQIDEQVDLQQDDRIDGFVINTISQLNGIVEGGIGLGVTQSFIDALKDRVEAIKNAQGDVDAILAVTGPSSELNMLISELTPFGPPDGVPGQGPPDETPGQGPPDETPGQGPPDDVPTFDDTPGHGPHEDPHDNPHDEVPGQGPPGDTPGEGPPAGKGKPADAGPPDGKGKPQDPGKPADKGPPDGKGKPCDTPPC